MRFIHVMLFSILSGWLQAATAAEISPAKTVLQPSSDNRPVLTIDVGSKSVKFTLSDIEKLPMYQTTLKTQWGMSGTFQGVLMSDLMEKYNLKSARRIVFAALDNYVAGLTIGELNGSPSFLATRFNGQAIPLDNKGPLILLWPAKEEAVLQGKASSSSWVWSIFKISMQQ